MKFVFLNLATAKESWSDQATQVYVEKLKHFVPFEIQHLSPKKASRDDQSRKLAEESKLILEFLQPTDFVVLFDERGKALSSRDFAKQLERIQMSGKKRCVWIIGGAFGVSDEVRTRADLKISLSTMVMNHLVAQTVALEQIYRGFAIMKNLPYHND